MKKILYLLIIPFLLVGFTPIRAEEATTTPAEISSVDEAIFTLYEDQGCTSSDDCHIIPYQINPDCPAGQTMCNGVCKKSCDPPPLVCKGKEKKCWDGKCHKVCPCKKGTKRCDDGTCRKSCEPPYLAGCDIKTSIMGKNLRALFCRAGDRYNISASVLAALYARESGKSWQGHTHVNRASFGSDIKSLDALVNSCQRNSATATGPTQIIDISWEGKPNWPVGKINGDSRTKDNCTGGACSNAKKAFKTSNPMSRCRWEDAVNSQAALLMIKFSYNAWQSKSACSISGIKGGKLVGPKWTNGCVNAIAHAYYGGVGYEDRVLDPFHDIKK